MMERVDFNTTPILQWPVNEQDPFPKCTIALTREEFEKTLGLKVFDWQWEWIKAFGNREKKIQWVQGRRGGRYEIIDKLKER